MLFAGCWFLRCWTQTARHAPPPSGHLRGCVSCCCLFFSGFFLFGSVVLVWFSAVCSVFGLGQSCCWCLPCSFLSLMAGALWSGFVAGWLFACCRVGCSLPLALHRVLSSPVCLGAWLPARCVRLLLCLVCVVSGLALGCLGCCPVGIVSAPLGVGSFGLGGRLPSGCKGGAFLCVPGGGVARGFSGLRTTAVPLAG